MPCGLPRKPIRMNYLDHTEKITSREDYPQYPGGSLMYCDPLAIKDWNSHTAVGDYPPTPPDSDSGLPSPILSDMSSLGLSQNSLAEDWLITESAGMTQCAAAGVHSPDNYQVSFADFQTSDLSAWHNIPVGSVDQSISPLSYASQSTHTLNSFSEPDGAFFLDQERSFFEDLNRAAVSPPVHHADSLSWSEGVVDTSSGAMPEFVSPFYGHNGCSMGAALPTQVGLYSGAAPAFFPQGGQVQYARRSMASPPPHMRPLLPRTDVSYTAPHMANGSLRVLKPQLQRPRYSISSSGTGQSHEGPHREDAWSRSPGPHFAQSQAFQGHAYGSVSSSQPVVSAASPSMPYDRSQRTVPLVVDSTDFDSFIHMGDEDPTPYDPMPSSIVPLALARLDKCGPLIPAATAAHMERKPALVESYLPESKMPRTKLPDVERKPVSRATSDGPMTSSAPGEEGRYRIHHHYQAGPAQDGQFHCPYKTGENACEHPPTKLKCNYDKYIDSHLKPFRCKVDTCATQAFSSTACLLRHEREAHGLHGHGDRPHLCHYDGCDRSQIGNGFPRKYNLYDHMKRVHDYKEDVETANGVPTVGESQRKGSAGRKRKTSGTSLSESVPQRPKVVSSAPPQAMSGPQQQIQSMPIANDEYEQPMFYPFSQQASYLPYPQGSYPGNEHFGILSEPMRRH